MEVTDEIRAAVESFADIYRNMLASSGHVASGNLKNFKTEVEFDGRYFDIIFALEDYWKYLENGRRAGKMPPISSILNWVRVRHIVPRSTTRKVPSSEQVAFMIARKIGRYGTPATHLLDQAINSDAADTILDQMMEMVLDQIQEEVDKEIEDEIN